MLFKHLVVLIYACGSLGLVTFRSIEEVTSVTRECTRVIRDASSPRLRSWASPASQNNPRLADENDDDLENIVTAALATLDKTILEILNKPLDSTTCEAPPEFPCKDIRHNFSSFVESIAKFLDTIYEVQQRRSWTVDSPVFHALAWLQALWASRRANERNRSFIEQQLALYSPTNCFWRNEVLRQDVEMVEFINDIMDTFQR